jgi:phospholipid/cholesterol/gamma-HCH transport system substrate-binding protein
MESTRKLAVTVGALFVGAVLVAFAVIVFLGQGGSLFRRRVTYHAQFTDVRGLREGAFVRLGGRVVGSVTDIDFGPMAEGSPTLVVTLKVKQEFATRVRGDSIARIGTQGLLGDKLVEISLGSPAEPELAEGGWLAGEAATDPQRILGAAAEATEHARNVLGRLDEVSQRLLNEGTIDELSETARSLRRIARTVEEGPGSAHELIYGRGLAADARAAVRSYARGGAAVESAAGRASALVDSVAPQVEHAATDMASVAADVRAGRGTLGGLLVDPTLYEETKRILVNIERNRVLKAVARLVVSDEGSDKVMDARPDDVVIHPRPGPKSTAQSGPGTTR